MKLELVKSRISNWWLLEENKRCGLWNSCWKCSAVEASKWILKQTKGLAMKTAEAYYIPDPIQIYVYIDEKEIKELPENAVLICKVESSKDLVKAVEAYFILGSGS